jgi:hypothetical protein
MKKLYLLIVLMANSCAMDLPETEIASTQTYVELTLARMRWAGNEDMVIHIHSKENVCLTSCTDHQKLAYLDNKNKLITTYFKHNGVVKTITHDHDEFKKFLNNDELLDHVRLCSVTKKNLTNLCTIQ